MEASNLNMHEPVGARPECWEEVKNRGGRWWEMGWGGERRGGEVGRRSGQRGGGWVVGGVVLKTGGSVRGCVVP